MEYVLPTFFNSLVWSRERFSALPPPYDASLFDEYPEDVEDDDEDELTEEEREQRAHWESFNNDPKLFEDF